MGPGLGMADGEVQELLGLALNKTPKIIVYSSFKFLLI